MDGAEVLDIGREAIWLTVAVSAPALLVGLIVGVVIGLIQALTQIQEQTLVYVPKILATFAAMMLFLPFMGDALAGYMSRVAVRIATGE